MEKYYIVIDNKQEGPFTIEELRNKNISQTTLVWSENMENWEEAKNVTELNQTIKKSPPPIPIKENTVIEKHTEKINSVQVEVIAANEIKINFKMFLYAFIIAIIAYPIIFSVNKGFTHMNMYNKWEKYYFSSSYDPNEHSNLIRQSVNLRYYDYYSIDGWERQFHKERYSKIAINSIYTSLIVFIVSALLLIIGRYTMKSAKWVNATAYKNI